MTPFTPPEAIRFEPYKIKVVEPIEAASPLDPSSVARREALLQEAGYNLFNIPARDVTIDLLTDSGTGAMSQEQWAAMMVGDESYARATSFDRFEAAVRGVIGEAFHIIPTHQGRAAENILFHVLGEFACEYQRDIAGAECVVCCDGRKPLRRRILINSFFDTTAANVLLHGRLTEDDRNGSSAEASLPPARRRRQDQRLKMASLITRNQLVVDQSQQDRFEHGIFGGNIDLDALERQLGNPDHLAAVMMVMLTITNNTGGGLPVSLSNMRAMRQMIDHYGSRLEPVLDGLPPLPFFFDAARFAENAWFIQQYEPGHKGRPVAEIAREMFSLVDGCTMSAKKDGLVNMGGFIATRHPVLRDRCREHMVEIEGFYTYGGLSGRDLEALAVGIVEGVNDARLTQRIGQVQRLWSQLHDSGIPVKSPCGGHGVFLAGRAYWSDADRIRIAPEDLPGQTLAVMLYRDYGIRSCEIGTVMFGDWDPATGRASRVAPVEDYVRLALPRRVYTDAHLDYVASAIVDLHRKRSQIPWRGMKFIHRPEALPHFLSRFEPLVR
ncbi:MAG: tryptophanase [Calditrichaeota bacterium]|nr:tryptophanase [Calditrichota bacterium]